MSAYMESKEHIDAMLTAGLAPLDAGHGPLRWWMPGPRTWANRIELTYETADRVGAMLVAENRRSVNHLYAEDELEELYVFDKLRGYRHADHALMMLMAVRGYQYQTCEHPEFYGSEAHSFVLALTSMLIGELPGFDESDGWSINSADVFKN